MQGALKYFAGIDQARGIIPADAGSTRRSVPAWEARRDHPRGCGEHDPILTTGGVHCGSSPRMRGAQGRDKGYPACIGIIPADAGSTLHMTLS